MGRDFENRKHAIFKTAAQKSKLYSRYGKQLYVLAKNGGASPENNPALKHLIERAKKDQVPAHVIEKACEKAAGVGGEDFVTVRYEGFGPGGCSVIVDCLTDNNNRTITDVRSAFTKAGARLGASGSVAHMFDHLAVLGLAGDNGDVVLEALLEHDIDVEDVECEEGRIRVFAKASEFYRAKTALQESFPDTELDVAEITFIPQDRRDVTGEDVAAFEKLMTLLNDCEDVQEIYHNARIVSEDEVG
jgi:YebC/PmpR family DNA-binding regulatory protein